MTTKKTRIKHTPEFKAETLKLADKVGVAAAARKFKCTADSKHRLPLRRTCLSKTLMRQHRTKNGLEILPI